MATALAQSFDLLPQMDAFTSPVVSSRREALDRLMAGEASVHEQGVDARIYSAASGLIAAHRAGRKVDIEAYGYPFDVLENVAAQLQAIGASQYATAQVMLALEEYVVGMGSDFSRAAKAKPLYARIMVTNKVPDDLPECEQTQATLLDGIRKIGGEAARIMVQNTVFGTKSTTSQGVDLNAMFSSNNNGLFVFFGAPQNMGVKGFDSVDAALVNLAQGMAGGGGMAGGAAAQAVEQIKEAIKNGEVTPQALKLIESLAALAQVTDAMKTPGAVKDAPASVADIVREITAQIQSGVTEGALPPAIIEGTLTVLQAVQANDVVQAVLAAPEGAAAVLTQTEPAVAVAAIDALAAEAATVDVTAVEAKVDVAAVDVPVADATVVIADAGVAEIAVAETAVAEIADVDVTAMEITADGTAPAVADIIPPAQNDNQALGQQIQEITAKLAEIAASPDTPPAVRAQIEQQIATLVEAVAAPADAALSTALADVAKTVSTLSTPAAAEIAAQVDTVSLQAAAITMASPVVTQMVADAAAPVTPVVQQLPELAAQGAAEIKDMIADLKKADALPPAIAEVVAKIDPQTMTVADVKQALEGKGEMATSVQAVIATLADPAVLSQLPQETLTTINTVLARQPDLAQAVVTQAVIQPLETALKAAPADTAAVMQATEIVRDLKNGTQTIQTLDTAKIAVLASVVADAPTRAALQQVLQSPAVMMAQAEPATRPALSVATVDAIKSAVRSPMVDVQTRTAINTALQSGSPAKLVQVIQAKPEIIRALPPQVQQAIAKAVIQQAAQAKNEQKVTGAAPRTVTVTAAGAQITAQPVTFMPRAQFAASGGQNSASAAIARATSTVSGVAARMTPSIAASTTISTPVIPKAAIAALEKVVFNQSIAPDVRTAVTQALMSGDMRDVARVISNAPDIMKEMPREVHQQVATAVEAYKQSTTMFDASPAGGADVFSAKAGAISIGDDVKFSQPVVGGPCGGCSGNKGCCPAFTEATEQKMIEGNTDLADRIKAGYVWPSAPTLHKN